MVDVSESRRLVREMAMGQKLESVGRIAAGVAHEINTSVQFISDSVRFVRHALKDVPRAMADYRALAAGVLSGKDVADQARRASETDEAADVDYFLKNAPDALDRALDGISRVGSIVRSMTEFAHPDAHSQADIDINRAIRSTLNMARNEYKAVAEVVTDFGDVPPVRCHAGDINQVVLNLLLNAAHAIGDVVKGSGNAAASRWGRVPSPTTSRSRSPTPGTGFPRRCAGASSSRSSRPRSRTRHGPGAGAVARHRGRKLKGSLHFETETGIGTTFYIRLPVSETAISAGI
jgi:signal transduction histidine kinase